MQDPSATRVGCVQYLNARPLIRGWNGEVTFATPSVLCAKLAGGELDVALASSFEFLRNPVYEIVDGVSISSDGEVFSVVVAHAGAIDEVAEIALDPASQTSVNLLRCLLAERGLTPRLVAMESAGPNSAQLLIGDRAIRFRQENPKLSYWDLGADWKKNFGLPFVYALWLLRPKVSGAPILADELRACRDENIASLERVVAEETDFDADFCRVYYREHVRYDFGDREKQGFREYERLCVKHGLLPERARDLVLL